MEKILKNAKVQNFINKYKYVALVLAVGIVLMLLPTGKQTVQEAESTTEEVSILSVEERLTQILRQVEGTGEVQVLLTEAFGEEIIYQSNNDISESDTSSTSRGDTVTVTDSERNEKGLIRQLNPPKYMGAVVVCQGGDQPTVRLAIIDAVSKVTGLGADKISILKMK